MLRFLTIVVSVKSGTKILFKRDSLFLRSWRLYDLRVSRLALFQAMTKSARQVRDRMQAVSDAQGRLLALVKSILKQNAIAADVEPATLLVDVGLTSMDMVNLMLSVEAEFDFTIPQSDITPENFQSVETLTRLVVGQLAPASAA
jgi:acyl carrier protein